VSRWGGATTWIVLTCVLGAAVIGLGIWVVVLETGHESESTASAARIHELEQAEADLSKQVPELETVIKDLEAQLEEEKAAAGAASDEAQQQLEALRDEVQAASDGLGAKGQELSDLQAELERLSNEAEADLAKAREQTATARDRTAAQRARADLAEACLGAVATVLEDLYASDDLEAQLGETAEELKAIAAECAPTG
jgi:predicted  nucleic acid-binding Zn-ribbon protein